MIFWVKRIKNKNYYIGLIISTFLVIIHFLFDVLPIINRLNGDTLLFLPATMWIGSTVCGSTSSFFYLLLPLYSVLCFNIISHEDKSSQLIKQYIQYRGIKSYSLYSLFINFASGFVVVALPLIIDFLMCLCTFPNIKPDIIVNIGLGISHSSMYFSHLFFTHPYVFIFIYIFGTGCLSGAYTSIAATIGMFTNRLYSSLLSVFIAVIGVSFFAVLSNDTVPSLLMLPKAVAGNGKVPLLSIVAIIWIVIMLLNSFFFVRGVKKHVTI